MKSSVSLAGDYSINCEIWYKCVIVKRTFRWFLLALMARLSQREEEYEPTRTFECLANYQRGDQRTASGATAILKMPFADIAVGFRCVMRTVCSVFVYAYHPTVFQEQIF